MMTTRVMEMKKTMTRAKEIMMKSTTRRRKKLKGRPLAAKMPQLIPKMNLSYRISSSKKRRSSGR